MISRTISIPELAIIAGTRAALGAGIALLSADRFSPETRRAVGWTLLGVGVLTTIPLLADVLFCHDADDANARICGSGVQEG